MVINGWGWDEREIPPSSDEVVEKHREYYLHAIDCFGPDRCMFESNFPVDKQSISYRTIWNAFKKMAKEFSQGDKDYLFMKSAENF